MTFSEERGSGRLAQWSPPPLPAHIDQPSQLTPADFMQGLAGLQQAMEQNALAMADFQRHQAAALELYQRPPAPAPYQPAPHPVQQWAQPQPMQPWSPPQWSPPAWHPPAQPIHTTISPVIRIDASSRSHQDNGGSSWFAILLGMFFLVPMSAAMFASGGGR